MVSGQLYIIPYYLHGQGVLMGREAIDAFRNGESKQARSLSEPHYEGTGLKGNISAHLVINTEYWCIERDTW